jgi:PKD repeat protein
VQVRITADDGLAGAGTPAVSGQFTVDNTTSPFPDADFIADTTTGPASLTVQFTDLSTGSFDSWLWDFGDGGTSNVQHPTHVYYLTGTYTVTLTIGGPIYGNDTATKVGYITVTDPPGGMTAAFVGSPLSGGATLTVDFQDQSVGDINRWSWDFGDGAVTLDRNPSHDYTAAGTYTVSLTVSGPGGSDTETKVGYVTVTGGGAIIPPSKKKSGCSCTVDAAPAPGGDVLGYFLPTILIACAYLALRRKNEAA